MGFKIKYDSRKVDRSKTGNWDEPPPKGLAQAVIKEASYRKDNDDINFVIRLTGDGKYESYKNFGLWDYVSLGEASAWRMDQYLQAIGIDTETKARGTVDITDFINKPITVRIKHETYEEEPRAKVGGVFPPKDEDEEDDEFEDDEEELEEDEEEEDEEDEEDEEEEDEEEDEDEELEDDEEEEEEEEEEPPARKAKSKKAPAAKAAPAKKSASKKAAAPPAKKSSKKAAAAPAKKARKPKYESMDADELRAECKARGLATKGTPTALMARLRANDDDPFSD